MFLFLLLLLLVFFIDVEGVGRAQKAGMSSTSIFFFLAQGESDKRLLDALQRVTLRLIQVCTQGLPI